MSDSPEYTLRWRGRQFGPFSLPEINRRLDEHEIGMGHEIHYHDKWINLEEFFIALGESASTTAMATQKPSLTGSAGGLPPAITQTQAILPAKTTPPPLPGFKSIATTPQSRPAAASAPAQASSEPQPLTRPRRRLVYALLGVFLGFVGMHNFYARNWLAGLLQLLLSFATYLLGFGIIVPWLWAMVEAVLVRKDGNGIEMI